MWLSKVYPNNIPTSQKVGYQITQQRAALANDGELKFPVIVPGKKTYYKKARLLQLQLEQDSGKSLHDEELKR